MVGSADDLGTRLERDLHDRVVAPHQARRAHWLDAHVSMRVDSEHIDARAAVRHVYELRQRLLLAVVQLDLRVSGEAAEVALPLDERVARREVLREAYERVVDRRVAVWVVLRHHHAHHVRRLPEWTVVPQALLEHGEEDPALHRL